ncbi:p450 domain-containing protein [Cephalotus follicularis]|uniref:p450 domain-containing protein n=1 Tax=Cephalotus follicularis TaxID=3775 RepID=A0A1Q3BXB1_CEPFO|nr:p450 domain-containing protein [Cephalotus follicularis]
MEILHPYLNTTIAALFAILVFSYCILSRTKGTKGPKPPEAAGKWPIIGHLHLLGESSGQLPHIKLGALADKYGPIFAIRIGVYPGVVVSTWELAKELFTTNDVVVSSRPKLTAGDHLGYHYANFGFSPYGSYWRELRKITALELLSNSRLELLKHVRTSEVEMSIKELYKQWNNGRDESGHLLLEMKQWFNDINLNVILRMVSGKRYFGTNPASEKKEARRCQKAMREFFHLAGLLVLRDAIPILGWLDLGGYEKAMKRTAKEFDSIMEEWLEEHRKKRTSGEVAKDDQDFIDVLLSVLDEIHLDGYDVDTVTKATAMTIIAGGTDTTTVSITWALALLLNNPHTLIKVQEELEIHIGKERLVNESDIDKLVYLQAVVKEALRLCPAGPLSGAREFTEDCTIGGYHVSAGTRLILNIWKIQTDPRIWSDPLKFNPERFFTTHKDVHAMGQHFELIPFGGGRRSCPGIGLALQMTHLVLATLLHSFHISTPSNATVDMKGTAGMTNIKATPLEVLIKPRLSLKSYE